ncbi:hypothetical protein [Sorangium sp. So ce513]|uniref:hypothetical protein n=1 Tax=Sorangium sp. So ce513 TaxID=3133315 RepID=UPI003F634F1D
MFEDFDFSVLGDPDYKEDAVREDLVAPLLRALGYQPTGRQRMQRSRSLLHPFVMIGSQKRAIHIIPDYTLWYDEQAVLVLDAKRPSEEIVQSHHVEQAFSYAIHPDVRTRSYALCNGRELVLYDIDKFAPVFRVALADLKTKWVETLKYLSPEALMDHHHREFMADLGIFLRNAGLTETDEITFSKSAIGSLGITTGGVLTATAAHDMVEGVGFQGSFDMPVEALPVLLSRLPAQLASMAKKALDKPGTNIWVGGIIGVTWTVKLGKPELGLFKHDPLIPLLVTAIHGVSSEQPPGPPPVDLSPDVLNLQALMSFL